MIYPLSNIRKLRVQEKIKGIVSTPMPKYWYDKRAVYDTFGNGDQEELEFQLRIVADRKPYFMRYVYGSIDLDCKRYEKSCDEYCGMAFRKKLSDMLVSDGSDLTEEEKNAVYYYKVRHPLSNNNCVMNRLCHKVESDISEKRRDFLTTDGFDYTILKSGAKYNQSYLKRMGEVEQEYAIASKRLVMENAEKTNGQMRSEVENRRSRINELYERALFNIVSSEEEACDMLLDLCYTKAGTKAICWYLFGDAIVENLIQKNAYCLEYPARCTNGEFSFRGNEYRMVRKEEYCD